MVKDLSLKSPYDGVTWIIHDNDPDGFGAAWAAWRRFRGGRVQFVTFDRSKHPEEYVQALPWDRLIFLDCAPSKPEMDYLEDHYWRVLVVDHHQTTLEEIGDRPNVLVDTDHSAAFLAADLWRNWLPHGMVPDIIKYVEDRDIWKNELPNTKEINAAISSLPFDFETWDQYAKEGCEDLLKQGQAIRRNVDALVREALEGQHLAFLHRAQVYVPAVNCRRPLASEVCHALLEEETEDPGIIDGTIEQGLAIGWRYSPDEIQCSVRSREGSIITARELAEMYGGGGHEHAAGFTVDIEGWLNV